MRLLLIGLLSICLPVLASQSVNLTLPNQMEKGQLLVLPLAQARFHTGVIAELSNDGHSYVISTYRGANWPDGSAKTLLLTTNQAIPAGKYQLHLKPSAAKQGKFSGKLEKERLAAYQISGDYLLQTGLRTTPKQDTDSNYLSWFYYGAEQYAKTIVENPKLQQSTSAWLYDYPATLYGIYFATGDLRWKHEAHQAAQFFASHIDQQGFFDRKPQDVKYIANLGLYLDSLLYPYSDNPAHLALDRLYQASLSWDPGYGAWRGFWTERHQAAALQAAVIQWERTQKTTVRNRVTQIISATHDMVFEPITDSQTGCAAHRHHSHQGGKNRSAVCSPWMSVLLADGLWRYWRLTGDQSSAEIIGALGRFLLEQGTYQVNRKYGTLTVPFYLKSLSPKLKLEINGWTDVQHNCDVASLVVRAGYLAKLSGDDSRSYRQLADQLLFGCERETIKMRTPDKKPRPWPISPLRKFNWWYNVPADLPWLYSRLD